MKAEPMTREARQEMLLAEIDALRSTVARLKQQQDKQIANCAENYQALAADEDELLIELTPSGEILEINPLWEGNSCAEWIGSPCWQFVLPEYISPFQEAIHQTLENQTAQSFSLEWLLQEGEQRLYKCKLFPILRERKVIRLLLKCQDVSLESQAVSQLRESEKHLHMIYESTHDFISILDDEGRFEFINKTVPPTKPQDLWGTYLWSYSPESSAETIRAALHKARQTGTPVRYENETLTVAGQQLWFTSIIHPVKNEGGKVDNFVVFSREVSELRAAKITLEQVNEELEERVRLRTQQLEQANEEILHFAYIVSHDLRVPLVNIKGFSEEIAITLQEIQAHWQNPVKQSEVKALIDEDIPESLYFINKASDRMDRLVEAVLKLARIGRTPMEPEKIVLEEVIYDLKETMQHRLGKLWAKIEIGALPTIRADRSVVEQIFGNLLDNSLKYHSPGQKPHIQLSAERKNDQDIIRVSDNGRGIDKKDFEQIFQIFRRSGKRDIPGEGMGLAYVKSLINLLNGEIEVESELGEGTTFTITLPVS